MPARLALPASVSMLALELGRTPGVVAVVLGGSRATGSHQPGSDWDLGVYYRGSHHLFDPADVRRLGHGGYVSRLGEWGPVVNGGAWLSISNDSIDVLFRDLDRVEAWHQRARRGDFTILAQTGYLVGAPTYLPVGELALCQPIVGKVARPLFPAPLAQAAPPRWRAQAAVNLMFARAHASAADGVGCAGMLAAAVLCAAHARVADRREWVLNEKRLVAAADIGEAQMLLGRVGTTPAELAATVTAVSAALDVAPLTAR